MTYLPKRVELKNLIKWLFSLKYTLHRALFTSRRWKKQSFCTHKLWPKKKNEKKTPDRRFCLIFCFQMKQEDCNLATGLHMWSQSLNSVLNYLTNYSTTNFSYFYLFFGVCVCVCNCELKCKQPRTSTAVRVRCQTKTERMMFMRVYSFQRYACLYIYRPHRSCDVRHFDISLAHTIINQHLRCSSKFLKLCIVFCF